MSDLPELDIEPRRPNLKAIRQTVSDDAVERHARKQGADWLGDAKPPLASLRVEIDLLLEVVPVQLLRCPVHGGTVKRPLNTRAIA